MSNKNILIIPIFTLIGTFLGWFLSFCTEYFKLKKENKKSKIEMLKVKIEKVVFLLYKVKKQNFELEVKLLNKLINNQDIDLTGTEEYFYELKSLIYLYLPDYISDFIIIENNIQGMAKFILPSQAGTFLHDKERAKNSIIEQYGSIEYAINQLMDKLFINMNKLIK